MMEETGKNYTYQAFISYKREDGKWARWLQEKLQSYRLPGKLLKSHRNLHPRLVPVFMDTTDLQPGSLEEELFSAVSSSRFLIVICSRHTHDSPVFIDKEIRFFLESGHPVTDIIPFIVGDSREPERECFPPALQELCGKEVVVGANIHDIDERRAFLKVVARMHGLALAEIESAESRRRKKKRLTIIVSVVVAVVLGTVASLLLYAYFAPHTRYYVDYTEVHGVPVGIGEISKEETKGMNSHFAIVTSKNLVRELKKEDSLFRLTSFDFGSELGNKPIDVLYSYDEDRTLVKTTYRDMNGDAKLICKYSNNLKVIDFIEEGEYVHSSYLPNGTIETTPFVWKKDGENGNIGEVLKSGIVRLLVGYDAHGCLSDIRYVSDSSRNEPVAEANGSWGICYERDAMGRITGITYLEYTGTFSSNGAENLGNYASGTIGKGIYRKSYTYDAKGNLTSIQYQGKDGEPMENKEGWTTFQAIWDEKHNLVATQYFNKEMQPTLGKSGISENRYVYDKDGELLLSLFYGVDGQPVLNEEGYAGISRTYDEGKKLKSQTFLDTEKQPVLSKEGYAGCLLETDDASNITKTIYLDEKGLPTLTNDGYAGWTATYDAQGNMTSGVCLGTDGRPIIEPNGYAGWTATYDAQGNKTSLSYYGLDGQPVIVSVYDLRIKYVLTTRLFHVFRDYWLYMPSTNCCHEDILHNGAGIRTTPKGPCRPLDSNGIISG